MLNLDLIYLAARDRADGVGFEVASTPEGPAPADRVQEIRRALDPWLKPDPPGLPPSIPDPLGHGAVPIVLNPFGSGESGGILVAGSRRADFPTEIDRLLLSVGANQAALLFERRRAEEALRASEHRFRTFVDHATDAFFLQAYDGVILDVNRQACQSLGYTRDELIGMTPFEFDPDLTPAMMEDMRRRGDAGEEVAMESRQRRKDGTVFPVEIRGRWFWEGGRRFIVSLARDITERKRLEAELRQARDRLDLAIRASNVGIWEVNMPDGVYVNGTGTWINVWEQLGLEPPGEDRPFVTWLDYTHPEDKDRLLHALHAYLGGETKEYQIEYRISHRDGTYRWMLARGTAIRDQAGKPIRLVGSRVDIAEPKRVEEVLRESEAWFRFLANAMPQIVWTARPDGSAQWVNQRCEDYTGIPLAEVLGEGWLSSIHPDDRDGVMTRWLADVVAGVGHDMEYRIRGIDGRYRWFKSRGLPVRDESGRVAQWLGTITDIDDQKRRGGAARERATIPHPGRGAAAHGLDRRAGRRARLLQRPQHRVHRTHPGAAPGLELAIDHPPRRSAPVPRAVGLLDRDRRALRDRVPAAPHRRRLPVAPRQGAGPPRRFGPDHQVVRVMHRHR